MYLQREMIQIPTLRLHLGVRSSMLSTKPARVAPSTFAEEFTKNWSASTRPETRATVSSPSEAIREKQQFCTRRVSLPAAEAELSQFTIRVTSDSNVLRFETFTRPSIGS